MVYSGARGLAELERRRLDACHDVPTSADYSGERAWACLAIRAIVGLTGLILFLLLLAATLTRDVGAWQLLAGPPPALAGLHLLDRSLARWILAQGHTNAGIGAQPHVRRARWRSTSTRSSTSSSWHPPPATAAACWRFCVIWGAEAMKDAFGAANP